MSNSCAFNLSTDEDESDEFDDDDDDHTFDDDDDDDDDDDHHHHHDDDDDNFYFNREIEKRANLNISLINRSADNDLFFYDSRSYKIKLFF